MTAGEPSALDRILVAKRQEVAALKAGRSLGDLRSLARDAPAPRDFLGALKAAGPVPLIAEIKRRSPSVGALGEDTDPAERARAYARGGAAALSVLTDGPFFGGALSDLAAARRAVDLPVLRKDFIIDPAQVLESRAAGADAVLLIAAALAPALLAELHGLARELGMTALVEVHHERELPAALAPRPRLVGVNNRDLRSLRVDLDTCLMLRKHIPPGPMVVAESGVEGPGDIKRLLAGGLDAFLVGTTLMRAADPGRAIAALLAAGRS